MDKDIVRKLKNAADRWEKENPIIFVGDIRICDALRDAAYAIEGLNDRLVSYAETGLKPEQIKQLAADRRITIADEATAEYLAYCTLGTIDDLTALTKARDEGRVVVPPVSLSQKIYKQSPLKSGVVEYTVTRIILSRFGFDFEAVASSGTGTRFSDGSIGKIVFLTRTEAEAALKGAAEFDRLFSSQHCGAKMDGAGR